jgi:hypothetical protein
MTAGHFESPYTLNLGLIPFIFARINDHNLEERLQQLSQQGTTSWHDC